MESTPASDGPDDSLRAVGVRGDFAAEAMGVGDDRLHLFEGVLRGLRVVALGEHAAGGADLDDVGAVLDDFANLVLHGLRRRRPRRRRHCDIRMAAGCCRSVRR